MSVKQHQSKRWYVTGIVQGVGFRYYVKNHAQRLNVKGYARNLSDGRVEVYAIGTAECLNDIASALHKGPAMSDVRSVEEMEAALEKCLGFEVR
jgi:acylphosphatase